MRLPDGFVVDNKRTLGVLKFSAMRRERMKQNEDGTASDELIERIYDLKCKEQGCMISVGIPAEVPLKEYEYDAEVELVNPVVGTVANATFNGADVDWWVKADDIVLKSKVAQPVSGNRPSQPHQQDSKSEGK